MTSRIVKYSIAAGLLFGGAMGFFFHLIYGASYVIPAGIACGFLSGISLAIFAETQRKKMESKDDSFEGEEVLYQGQANHFLNKESRGGWLTLTSNRLAFRSHGKNIQNVPLDILLKDIESASSSATLGVIPNGLRVAMHNGKIELFVISNRKKWVYLIEKAKAEQGSNLALDEGVT